MSRSVKKGPFVEAKLFARISEMIEKGEMTSDLELVGKVIEDICINNIVEYLGVKKNG